MSLQLKNLCIQRGNRRVLDNVSLDLEHGRLYAVLGANGWRRLFDIDLRRMRPALVAALGLIVAVSLGEFGAASLLSRDGAETLPVAIARLLARTGDLVRAEGFVLATILIVACVGVLAIVESALGRRRHVAGR